VSRTRRSWSHGVLATEAGARPARRWDGGAGEGEDTGAAALEERQAAAAAAGSARLSAAEAGAAAEALLGAAARRGSGPELAHVAALALRCAEQGAPPAPALPGNGALVAGEVGSSRLVRAIVLTVLLGSCLEPCGTRLPSTVRLPLAEEAAVGGSGGLRAQGVLAPSPVPDGSADPEATLTLGLAAPGYWAALDALLAGAPLRSLAGAPGLAPLMAAGGRLAPLVRLLAVAADVPPADACALVRALLAGDSRASAAARKVRSCLVAACVTSARIDFAHSRQHRCTSQAGFGEGVCAASASSLHSL